MGGFAFTKVAPDGSAPLHVPRLTPEAYVEQRDRYKKILMTLFTEVVSPIEAPGKSDYGDVDYIAYGPLQPAGWTAEEIAHKLGAFRFDQTYPTKSFAVARSESGKTEVPEAPQSFVQLDIEIVGTLEMLRWQTFKKSYGDLWPILGAMVSPLGLVADDRGFHLKIQEMEQNGFGKRAARLFLTSDPKTTMEFLGLDVDSYKEGFSSEVECRAALGLFNFPSSLILAPASKLTMIMIFATVFEWLTSTFIFYPSGFASLHYDKSRDRQCKKGRPMFRRFHEDYIKSEDKTESAKESSQVAARPTRESILHYALDYFSVRDIYNAKLEEVERRKRNEALRKRLVENLSALYSRREVRVIMRAWAQHLERSQGNSEHHTATKATDATVDIKPDIDENGLFEWFMSHALEILENEGKAVHKQPDATPA